MIDLTSLHEKLGVTPFGNADEHREGCRKLAAYYGCGNDHGAITHGEKVPLAIVGKSRAFASVVQTGTGVWLVGHDFQNAVSGSGAAPSVWSRKGYETREDAIKAVALDASAFFAGQNVSSNSCIGDSARAEARQMVAALAEVITPGPTQLSLF